jgi:hypothetical protein
MSPIKNENINRNIIIPAYPEKIISGANNFCPESSAIQLNDNIPVGE